MNNTLTFFPFLNKYNSNNKKQPPKECADKDSIINNITVTTIFFLLFESRRKTITQGRGNNFDIAERT